MRKRLVGLIVCGLYILAAAARAQDVPELVAPVRLLAIQGDNIPEVVDWDNDGDQDLVIGVWSFGRVFLYLNSGSDTGPLFGAGTAIQSDGVDITSPYW